MAFIVTWQVVVLVVVTWEPKVVMWCVSELFCWQGVFLAFVCVNGPYSKHSLCCALPHSSSETLSTIYHSDLTWDLALGYGPSLCHTSDFPIISRRDGWGGPLILSPFPLSSSPFLSRRDMHYYKMWVQFTSPHSLDEWIHCYPTSYLVRSYSL
jgi:hypothetical protein